MLHNISEKNKLADKLKIISKIYRIPAGVYPAPNAGRECGTAKWHLNQIK